MDEDDAALVERCLAGDERALRAFVERFRGAVFGLCCRMLGHREDAEDTAQDVFLRAFRSLARWDRTRPVKPWLLAIAANRCRTAMERRGRQAVASEAVTLLAADAPPAPAGDLGEELELALRSLRDEYRICFTLFYQQELSCSEIGDVLGCPLGTVKTWLHRARKELAEFLQRRGVVPDVHHELHRI